MRPASEPDRPERPEDLPLSIDELLAIPYITDVTTDGRGRIAWTELRDGYCNAFVASAPHFEAHCVTNFRDDDGQSLTLLGFAPGRDFLVVKRGKAGFNPATLAEAPAESVLRIDTRTGESITLDPCTVRGATVIAPDGVFYWANQGSVWCTELAEPTRHRKLFTVRGKVTELLIAPDGSKFAFVTNRSIYNRGKYAYVGVYDLSTGALTYMEPGMGLDQNLAWSTDSRRVAFIRFGYEPRTWRFSDHREGAPFSIVVADAATGAGKAIFTSELGYGCRFNGFDASGYSGLGGRNNLLWLCDDTLVFPYEKTGWKLLYAISANGGAPRLLTPGTLEIDGVTLSPDRMQVVFWANSETDPHRLDLYAMSAHEGWSVRRMTPPAGNDIRHKAVFVDDDTLAYQHAGAQLPERLVVQHERRAIQLSNGPKPGDVAARKGQPGEIVTFESLDGLNIPAILYRPKDVDPRRRHPILVHAHGGSRYKMYPAWIPFFTLTGVAQYLLTRGYFVLVVNYRSGTGYGLDFREPPSYGGRGAGDVDDFIAAARFIKTSIPEVDPDKLVLYGHSYGGHIVSNALARSDEYAAGIDSAGVGDWVVEMEKDFDEVLQFNIPQRLELEQLAYDSSAISRIDDWGDRPLLLLHGDNDSDAAMQQSLELYLALQKRGKPVEALVMPDEGHGVFLRKNRVVYLRKIEDFLNKYVHGARHDAT